MRMNTLLGSVVAFLFIGAVTSTPAQAERWQDCRAQTDRAERHLDHMLQRFGPRSDPVRDARFDVERIRDWCFRHKHDRDWRERDWHGRRDRDWGRHMWTGLAMDLITDRLWVASVGIARPCGLR